MQTPLMSHYDWEGLFKYKSSKTKVDKIYKINCINKNRKFKSYNHPKIQIEREAIDRIVHSLGTKNAVYTACSFF